MLPRAVALRPVIPATPSVRPEAPLRLAMPLRGGGAREQLAGPSARAGAPDAPARPGPARAEGALARRSAAGRCAAPHDERARGANGPDGDARGAVDGGGACS
ncbi:hypothetical protein WMF18_08320 [Sorangium sp. So ce315]|uniref:hypothetical protein n=1 Tax=Sorangium sp. So ce315 TaxID=3133299 RepID=UPI003F628C31